MSKLTAVFVGVMLSTAVFAGTSTYVEVGYITGGENGENGAGQENGFEAAGAFAISDVWYVGGVLGTYDRRDFADNDYVNLNGGMVRGLTDQADLIVELGLWGGNQEQDSGTETDPMSLELKFGLSHMIGERFAAFGTVSLVAGDLDTDDDSDLRNFIWSAGGAYNFSDHFSVSLKVVEGSNGVNGQSDVARIGARWTF